MKTIIFDMDGVIVDSEDFYCKAWIETYREIGINITPDYYFSKICGHHGLISSKMMLNKFKKIADPNQLVLRKEEISVRLMNGKIKPIDGVIEIINKLHKNGYKIGLASTTSMFVVSNVLRTIGIDNKFNAVFGGESVVNGKPNPEVYLKIAKILETEPENCIVIEDSKRGIISAKSAGMSCIGFLNGRNKKDDLQYADIIVDSFDYVTEELINNI